MHLFTPIFKFYCQLNQKQIFQCRIQIHKKKNDKGHISFFEQRNRVLEMALLRSISSIPLKVYIKLFKCLQKYKALLRCYEKGV